MATAVRSKPNRVTVGPQTRRLLGARSTQDGSEYAAAALRWQEALNRRMSEAGAIPGLEGTDPEFAARLRMMIAQSEGRLGINSAHRTIAHQKELFDAAVAKYGSVEAASKWVAPPGESNHNPREDGYSRAVDLTFNGNREESIRWAHDNAARFGLVFPMSWEPWHIEPVGVREDPATPATAYTDQSTKNRMPTPQEAGAHIANAFIKQSGGLAAAVEAANQQEQAGPEAPEAQPSPEEQLVPPSAMETEAPGIPMVDRPSANFASPTFNQEVPQPAPEPAPAPAIPGAEPTGDASDMDSVIRRAMAVEGITDEQAFQTAKHRMMVESGGRNIQQQITDVNSGGNEAFGPWQFVRGTFQRFAHPEYQNWHDPFHQAVAFFRAVKGGKYQGNFRHPELLSNGGWSP